MPMDEERREYLKEYKKNCLKRIPLEVPHELYEKIKVSAEIEELSVNRYIRNLIEEDVRKKDYTINLRMERSGNSEGRTVNTIDAANKVEYEKEFVMTPNGKQVIYKVKRQ